MVAKNNRTIVVNDKEYEKYSKMLNKNPNRHNYLDSIVCGDTFHILKKLPNHFALLPYNKLCKID